MRGRIYAPTFRCSPAPSGPAIDPVPALRKQEVTVDRFNPAQQLRESMSKKTEADRLHREGKECR